MPKNRRAKFQLENWKYSFGEVVFVSGLFLENMMKFTS